MAALAPEHERAVRTNHLLGRQGYLLDRPAIAGQTPQRLGGERQVRRQHQWLLGAWVVDDRTPQRQGSRLRRGKHQVVPDLGLDRPPGHDPLGGGVRGRRGNGLAFVLTGQGAYPLPVDWTTPPTFVDGPDVAPGRKVTGHPCNKTWHAPRQQRGHAEPGVDDEDFVRLSGGSRLRDGPALQRRVTAVARFGP